MNLHLCLGETECAWQLSDSTEKLRHKLKFRRPSLLSSLMAVTDFTHLKWKKMADSQEHYNITMTTKEPIRSNVGGWGGRMEEQTHKQNGCWERLKSATVISHCVGRQSGIMYKLSSQVAWKINSVTGASFTSLLWFTDENDGSNTAEIVYKLLGYEGDPRGVQVNQEEIAEPEVKLPVQLFQ